jgi:hypothetical protein
MNISIQRTEPMSWCAGRFLLNEVKLCFLTVCLVNYYITAAVHIQFTPICKISQPSTRASGYNTFIALLE